MNRLQYESSPYLLQHAHNPVDWYAWRPEAFERARAEQKPILVSIGYSTCHWCHVMERESFEQPDVAAFMNTHYINIKVDREERPDVDSIYMEACQILTGGGGWPLNCFLTPEGKPFYAGTYFPPRPAYNRPSWLQVLEHLANIWETQRDTAYEQAEKLLGYIRRNDEVFVQKPAAATLVPDTGSPFTPALLENIFYQMRERFDRAEGGFGGAPKFPGSMALHFLLHYHWASGHPEALEHTLFSLDRMIMGGIYDQLGGGFARYATDREWLVPHFEKMLYDNALLVTVLADAYKLLQSLPPAESTARRQALYRETIEETLGFIEREMTHPSGGFFAALDADSEGEEGKYYVWEKSEIEQLLGEDAPLFCAFYGVSEHGNWEEKNILWRARYFDVFAQAQDMDEAALKIRLHAAREKLRAAREKRIRPGLDDKVLLGWNALMASACAAAYTALGHEKYRGMALQNVKFLQAQFSEKDEPRLRHTWKNGQAQYAAVLDDYAFLIAALVDVWQITFDSAYLALAETYTEQVLEYFHDAGSGLFFFTAHDQQDIVFRKKDLYDNATPSGNSTMAHNLQRLGILLDRPDWRELAMRMLLTLKDSVERYPMSFERWALALLHEVHPHLEIALVGDDALSKALRLQNRFLPGMVIAAAPKPDENQALLAGKAGAPEALIYICRNYTCQKPLHTLEAFFEQLRSNRGPAYH